MADLARYENEPECDTESYVLRLMRCESVIAEAAEESPDVPLRQFAEQMVAERMQRAVRNGLYSWPAKADAAEQLCDEYESYDRYERRHAA